MFPTGIVLTEKVKETSFMYLFLKGLGQLVLVECMKILFFTFILKCLRKTSCVQEGYKINYHKL